MKKAMPHRPKSWRIVEKEVDGVKMSFLTIGAVARALGRAVSTLRVWEREGLLPKTPHRSDTGHRLYTIEQLQEIRARAKKDPKFSDLVRKKRRTDQVIRRVRWMDGTVEEVALYRVRVLAKEIGRTPQTIRLMERRHGLPPTPLRSGNQRLYTMAMIEVVKGACAHKKYLACWSDIYLNVLTRWQEMGVLGGQVLEGRTNEGSIRRRDGVPENSDEGEFGTLGDDGGGDVHSDPSLWEDSGRLGAGGG